MTQDDVSYVLNILRQGTVKWSGRRECLRRARKRVLVRHSKDGNPIYKYFWKCANCKNWFRNEKEMEVDHIKEIGSFTGDWNYFIPAMYARQENLQAMCVGCHLKKTKQYNSARTKWERKIRA